MDSINNRTSSSPPTPPPPPPTGIRPPVSRMTTRSMVGYEAGTVPSTLIHMTIPSTAHKTVRSTPRTSTAPITSRVTPSPTITVGHTRTDPPVATVQAVAAVAHPVPELPASNLGTSDGAISAQDPKVNLQTAFELSRDPPTEAPTINTRYSPKRKEADVITWAKIPEKTGYERWRHRMIANIISAAYDTDAATAFAIQIASDDDVSQPDRGLRGLDAKLRSALLAALDDDKSDSSSRVMASYALNPTISGRQLFRLIDADHGLRNEEVYARKNLELLSLRCKTFPELSNFLVKWKQLDATIVGTNQDLPDATKRAHLRKMLAHLPEVSAILARDRRDNGSYSSLIRELTDFEAVNRTWGDDLGTTILVAGSATTKAPPTQPIPNPCRFCTDRLRGTNSVVRHTDKDCRTNPNRNSNHRPAPRDNRRAFVRPQSQPGPSAPRPTLDAVLRDQELLRLLSEHLSRVAPTSRPKAGAVRRHVPLTLDSGASISIVNGDTTMGEVVSQEALDAPVDLDCVGGITRVLEKVLVDNPDLGRLEALHVANSPPLVSLGQLIQKGFAFAWSPDNFNAPSLVRPDGLAVPLHVEQLTPVFSGYAAKARPVAHTHDHAVLHFPMEPSCLVCQVGKAKRVAAKRVPPAQADVAKAFFDRVSIDLIFLSNEDAHGNKFLFTFRDDCMGIIGLRPQKTKSAEDSLSSFLDITREFHQLPLVVRSDNGTEFLGSFEEHLRSHNVSREFSIPHVSTTNARHERMNQEVNRALRVLLFQAGLPLSLWSYAARYYELVFNHLHTPLPIENLPRNPCEKRTGVPCQCLQKIFNDYGGWPNFGALASYIPADQGHKFASRTQCGVVVGFNGHVSLQVIDLANLENGKVTIRDTRDVAIDNEAFPARLLKFRPDSDLLFYRILSAAENQPSHCPQCKQPRTLAPIQCPKCLDGTTSIVHARDQTCRLGCCRCTNNLSASSIAPISYWEFPDSTLDSAVEEAPQLATTQAANASLAEFDDPKVLLTRVISADDALLTQEGQAALSKEVNTMKKYGTWVDSEVIEHSDVLEADAEFVKVKLIMAIKHCELAPEHQVMKARLVAQGCVVKDARGYISPKQEFPYEVPSNLTTFRLLLWFASLYGNTAWFGDIKGAYLQAELKGPPTYLELPKSLWPEDWHKMNRPVVRAHKALYGLARSGSDFGEDARARLIELGWTCSTMDKNLYYKPMFLLSTYVDDMGLVGPRTLIKDEAEKLREEFGIEEFSDIEKGPVMHLGMELIADTRRIKVLLIEYMTKMVHDYCALVEKPVLRRAKTPGWSTIIKNEGETPGNLAKHAATIIGRLLWLSRTCRPDITQAVRNLCSMTSEWTQYSDRCLERLMQYLFHHRSNGLTYRRKNSYDLDDMKIRVYADADHSGLPNVTQSTSGYATFFEADGYRDVIDWSSKLQTVTATSTAAAELVALNHALHTSLLPLETVIEQVFSETVRYQSILLCDNATAVSAVRKGYSTKLRGMEKSHKVILGSLHDLLTNQTDRRLEWVPTDENVADIFTKNTAQDIFSRHMDAFHIPVITSDAPPEEYLPGGEPNDDGSD